MKKNLLVAFGGVSCEHDISVITAIQAIKHLSQEKYNIIPLYITKQGKWLHGKVLSELSYFLHPANYKKNVFEVSILPNNNALYLKKGNKLKKMLEIDVALLTFHGTNGEDGSVSALFQLNSIPFSSCGMITSAICIEKVFFKHYAKGAGYAVVDYYTMSQYLYDANKDKKINEVEQALSYPMIVKPSKLGSSIGISVCRDKKQLKDALELAFELDEQVLIEEFLEDIKEVNCAIMGVGKEVTVSELEQPIREKDILTFENKYLNRESNGNMEFLSRIVPPDIPDKTYRQVVEMSKKLFYDLQLKGVVRIDYIIKDDVVYLNEINAIPGSLSNYLFKHNNISYTNLLNNLVDYAFIDANNKQQKIKTFKSEVLSNVNFDLGVKK